MNLGDGLLFELENGKPKLILLSHAHVKNPAKLSIKPRAAKILSSRQPAFVVEVQGGESEPGQVAESHVEVKAAGKLPSSTSNKTTAEGRNTILTSSKAHPKDYSVKVVAKVRNGSNKHKLSTTAGPSGANRKPGQPPNTGARRSGGPTLTNSLGSVDGGLKDSVVCLTSEQLQQLLNAVKTPINGQNTPEEQMAEGSSVNARSGSPLNEGGGGDTEEDKGGGEELKGKGERTDANRSSLEKDDRLSRSLFSWLDERQSDSRATIDAKKAQWKRELDEQVALKQQQSSAPGRLQVVEYAESVLSVQTSVSHREQPAAIRSSLKLGEVTPMEEVLSVERKEERRRHWLEELDRQRQEVAERRKREKLLHNQTEDHERWAAHFDSLQQRPLIQTPAVSAPPPGQLNGSGRRDWDPSSSLSLVWDATSSCGAESVIGASVDSTSGYQTRTSYLRTMNSLLDPAQIEERERRRLKQLEQQRAIEAQMEERRKQREQEEAKRRQEEEEEERRLAQEREKLQKQYELEMMKKKLKEEAVHRVEQPERVLSDDRQEETPESSTVTGPSGVLENASGSTSSYKDTAVQTEEIPPLVLTADKVQNQRPPPSRSAAPPNDRSRVQRTGKENICVAAGGDPYEPFARTERSRREKRRPEWNTHRPSHRFVPASERYPPALQKNRQESRLKRQAELLALQERSRLSRTEPPPPLPQRQEHRLCSNTQQTNLGSTRKVETGFRGHNNLITIGSDRLKNEAPRDTEAEVGRSPLVPAVEHKVQGQQASTSPPPVLEFIPYVRTEEVFHLDPLEPVDTHRPQTHSGAPHESPASPPAPSHRDPLLHPELLCNTRTQRQQEILRGLAQLRQGLLQKQKELETNLDRHDNKQRVPSTTRHT